MHHTLRLMPPLIPGVHILGKTRATSFTPEGRSRLVATLGMAILLTSATIAYAIAQSIH
jgi:hypothetical protein